MIYDRERFRGYTDWIIAHRRHITAVMVLLMVAIFTGFQPRFSNNDASLWISGSKEQHKNETRNMEAVHMLKLVYDLHPKELSEDLATLRALHKEIRSVMGVQDVRSILTVGHPFQNRGEAGSMLLEIDNLCGADGETLKKTVASHPELYRPYVDSAFEHLYIYIFADSSESLGAIRSFVDQAYIAKKNAAFSYTAIIMAVVATTALLFWLVFRNFIPAFVSVAVTASSLMVTIFLAQTLFGIERVHLAVTLLTLAIAQMDFLYFYYRWHVSQFKIDSHEAVHKALNRNTVPAFWTSVVTAAGLGSLVFIDIPVLHQIGVFALLSAFFGFFFSVTLLPALLAFFRIHNAIVPFSRFSTYFAAREIHYNRRLLVLFLALVMAAGLYSVSNFIAKPPKIFDHTVYNDSITVAVPYSEIDQERLALMAAFEQELLERFPSVKSVESIHTIIHSMAKLEGTAQMNEQEIGRLLFFTELYGEADRVLGSGRALIHIWLEKESTLKSDIVEWARQWKHDGEGVYLIDRDSLVYAAKSDDALIMSASILTALMLIGVIMFVVTRKYQLLLISWIINAIPLVIFALLIVIFKVPLSIEILIAATIMLGLASDATIHFSYKYMQSRHFYHKRIKALEKVFFYAGLPVIIGNLLLSAIFFVLAGMGGPTLETIGLFAGGLILVSLVVDLFLMPVLLLFVDKNHALEE